MRLRAWLLCGALGLCIGPAAAQAPSATEGEAHLLSAFTSGADPGVLAASVELGPALRKELGGETDGGKVYAALFERTSGKRLRVNVVAPSEAMRFASLPGVKWPGEPLIRLEAGDAVYLFQYASAQKNATFVEQLGKPDPRSDAAKPEQETPEPPPLALPTPTPVEAPKPAARTDTPPPRECIIKPVMSDEDLRNCAAASTARSAAPIERPAGGEKPRPECIIKAVMSEEDLRNCAAALSSPHAAPAAVEKAQTSR